MKLIRFGAEGQEHPGIITEDGRWLDVRAFGEDYDESFLGSEGPARLADWLLEEAGNCPEISQDLRLGPPITRPSKIICVGLNYASHAKESGMTPPDEPLLFFKATSAICGPHDEVIIPRGSRKVDWEVELAIVIGKKASYVSEENALDHVA